MNSKIKAGPLPARPLGENPFADSSSHLFVADRTQHILLSNTKSLYSTVTYGKGITDDARFIERALSSLRESMEDDGQAFVHRRFIAQASGTIRFARALDRSVTGSDERIDRPSDGPADPRASFRRSTSDSGSTTSCSRRLRGAERRNSACLEKRSRHWRTAWGPEGDSVVHRFGQPIVASFLAMPSIVKCRESGRGNRYHPALPRQHLSDRLVWIHASSNVVRRIPWSSLEPHMAAKRKQVPEKNVEAGAGQQPVKMTTPLGPDLALTLPTTLGKALELSYWDLWFALVAVRLHDGDLDRLSDRLKDEKGFHYNRDSIERKKPLACQVFEAALTKGSHLKFLAGKYEQLKSGGWNPDPRKWGVCSVSISRRQGWTRKPGGGAD